MYAGSYDCTAAIGNAQVVQEPLEQRSWIVCDGDVDPEWIESLNSVLDDNRLLTMPNGERIQFGSNVNLIFECDSLAYASPATISRCVCWCCLHAGLVSLHHGRVSAPCVPEAALQQTT
jgi:hypothetical protein